MLFVHTPVTLATLDVRQHSGAMIVAFDSDQRSSVFLRKVYRDASKILRAQPFTKLRTLQPCRNLHHLHRGKVTNVPSPRGVHRNYILASHNRLEPHLQRAVASPLHRLWRLSHTLIQRIDVKTTSSRRSEAGRSILGKLLRPKQTVGPIQTATEPDLPPSQAVLRDQSTLLRAHRLFSNCRPVVRRLHPPRKEVPHDIAVRVRLIRRCAPFVVERAVRSIRGAFQHHLSLRSKRGPQSCKRHCSIAGPPAHLTAVQVLNAQTAAGIKPCRTPGAK